MWLTADDSRRRLSCYQSSSRCCSRYPGCPFPAHSLQHMHFSKGLFSTHPGSKCIIFTQEIAKIILLGLESQLQKCCCYKQVFCGTSLFLLEITPSLHFFPFPRIYVWLFFTAVGKQWNHPFPDFRPGLGVCMCSHLILNKKNLKKTQTNNLENRIFSWKKNTVFHLFTPYSV